MNPSLKEHLVGAALLAQDAQALLECVPKMSGGEDQLQILNKAIASLQVAADECRYVKSQLLPIRE